MCSHYLVIHLEILDSCRWNLPAPDPRGAAGARDPRQSGHHNLSKDDVIFASYSRSPRSGWNAGSVAVGSSQPEQRRHYIRILLQIPEARLERGIRGSRVITTWAKMTLCSHPAPKAWGAAWPRDPRQVGHLTRLQKDTFTVHGNCEFSRCALVGSCVWTGTLCSTCVLAVCSGYR